tara:strand:- start:5379 stop:5594 length:216 start_codon:yes stop_codon:yes gene_type:complete
MSWRDDLHNEMNPDMRSFGSKGTSSVNPHDEAEREKSEKLDELRSNADIDDDDDDEMTEDDMLDSMHGPEV